MYPGGVKHYHQSFNFYSAFAPQEFEAGLYD